jgi:hypothetical protein
VSAVVDEPRVNDLQVACEELNRRGCHARLRRYEVAGDADLRLQVVRAGGRVLVEVLAPTGPDAEWHAVRVASGDRTIWCGPARSDVVSGLDLVPFVEDLLSSDVEVLGHRYRDCG